MKKPEGEPGEEVEQHNLVENECWKKNIELGKKASLKESSSTTILIESIGG